MKLTNIINYYSERGANNISGGITLSEIYKNKGEYPVYSASSNGPIGFYNKFNYEIKDNSFIYTLNGEWAGSILITQSYTNVWISSDTGVLEIKSEFIDYYGKEVVGVYLDYLFKSSRHNTGARPKFSLKKILSYDIDFNILNQIKDFDQNKAVARVTLLNKIKSISKDIEESSDIVSEYISISDLIDYYIERGKRLTIGKDLYPNKGEIPVYSADTTGPMGFYNNSNYCIEKNSLIYTIDGELAGSTLFPVGDKIWLTDHAGIIKLNDYYVENYGIIAIAVYLDLFFKSSLDVLDGRKQFLIKKIMDKNIDLSKIKIISKEIKNL